MSVAIEARFETPVSQPLANIPTVQEICTEAKKEAGVVRLRSEKVVACFLDFMGKAIEQVRFSGKPRPLALPELEVYRNLLGLFIPQEGRPSPTTTYQLIARRLLLPGECVWWGIRADEERVCACDGTVIGLAFSSLP